MAIDEITEREQHVVVDQINSLDKPGVGHHLFYVPFVAQAQCWPSRAVGVCNSSPLVNLRMAPLPHPTSLHVSAPIEVQGHFLHAVDVAVYVART